MYDHACLSYKTRVLIYSIPEKIIISIKVQIEYMAETTQIRSIVKPLKCYYRSQIDAVLDV